MFRPNVDRMSKRPDGSFASVVENNSLQIKGSDFVVGPLPSLFASFYPLNATPFRFSSVAWTPALCVSPSQRRVCRSRSVRVGCSWRSTWRR